MLLPADYPERVYAGVLGKLIGVYLGRPFEGWTHERILADLGEIDFYVHDRFGTPLVVTDDDVAGTFTFLRALPDHGCRRDLGAREVGRSWLNYLVEGSTTLWWGGNGVSTEHTAWLNLRRGIEAPGSGSAARNGPLVAEQIGAQIFIDGWGMVAPGEPRLAATLAAEAARVSHDGAAVHAAQLLAAMVAQAFVERDVDALLDVGLGVIPGESPIARLIGDLRAWHAQDDDWYATRARIEARYGYHRYGGGCHVIPNHAVVILALLYGRDDLQHALRIATTAGWDTDCNAGNVGCLMAIKEGLAGLERGPDWRTPIADRLYLPSADGGRAITDAVTETGHVVRTARALHGLPPTPDPKGGARFHFELPGSVQGWQPRPAPDTVARAWTENVTGHSRQGHRSLALRFAGVASGRHARFATATFIPPEAIDLPGSYELLACPTLHPGQTVETRIEASADTTGSVEVQLFASVYDGDDTLIRSGGPAARLEPGDDAVLTWRVPDPGGMPVAEIGFEIRSQRRADGAIFLDRLGWEGTPDVRFVRPPGNGTLWRRAWVPALDHVGTHGSEAFHLSQDRGRGLLIQGGRTWRDYRVAATIVGTVAPTIGICARVQGLERYYALLLRSGGTVALIKRHHGDHPLAEAPFAWARATRYRLELEVEGNRLRGRVDGVELFDLVDRDDPFAGGGVALLVEEGLLTTRSVEVGPLGSR